MTTEKQDNQENQATPAKQATPEKLYLNIQEAADYLGIPKHQLYKLVKLSTFPAKKMGVSWRINKARLDRWAYMFIK